MKLPDFRQSEFADNYVRVSIDYADMNKDKSGSQPWVPKIDGIGVVLLWSTFTARFASAKRPVGGAPGTFVLIYLLVRSVVANFEGRPECHVDGPVFSKTFKVSGKMGLMSPVF
jgi:hypothetical protein